MYISTFRRVHAYTKPSTGTFAAKRGEIIVQTSHAHSYACRPDHEAIDWFLWELDGIKKSLPPHQQPLELIQYAGEIIFVPGGWWHTVCMCAYMYACMHVCMHVCVCACVYVCMYVSTPVCVYSCLYVCMHACRYVYMYACIHAYMYASCPPVCMYACTYIR